MIPRQEKISLELTNAEWHRIGDRLEKLDKLERTAGARQPEKDETSKAFTSLEIAYNKATGTWELGDTLP